MKKYKNYLIALTCALSAVLMAPAYAQADLASGEVRKIDIEASKITIKHGEIKSIDMPPMTMVFTVKNPELLYRAKVGEKVKFSIVRDDGKLVVTEIVTAP
jgi:Cu/Ag efflux protein CusF